MSHQHNGGMLLKTSILKFIMNDLALTDPDTGSILPKPAAGIAFCINEANRDSVNIILKLVYKTENGLEGVDVPPEIYINQRRAYSFNDGNEKSLLTDCKFDFEEAMNQVRVINATNENVYSQFQFGFVSYDQMTLLIGLGTADILVAGITSNYGSGLGIVGGHFNFKLEPFPAVQSDSIELVDGQIIGLPTFVTALPCPPGWRPEAHVNAAPTMADILKNSLNRIENAATEIETDFLFPNVMNELVYAVENAKIPIFEMPKDIPVNGQL